MIHAMADAVGKFADIGRRLVRLREALGLPTDAALAKRLDVSPQKLSNYMRGRARPDLSTGLSIVAKTGVSLDWLYRGEIAGLSVQMAQMLGEVPEQPARKARSR